MLEVRWHGRGGQGAFTASKILSPITDRSVIHKADYIVYLDETLYSENVKNDLKVGGKIYLNSRKI